MKMYLVLIMILTVSFNSTSQEKSYWKKTKFTNSKLYEVVFIDSNSGWAESMKGIILRTTDGGSSWEIDTEHPSLPELQDIEWRADVYCAVMSSSDGGESWFPYLGQEQEHFCTVYFDNRNTGWQSAREFLNKVVGRIKSSMEKGELDLLLETSVQCTEYYTDVDSGWALGWCLKDFNFK